METKACFLLVVLAVSVALPYMCTYHAWKTIDKDEFYFGVTYGFNSTTEAKLLIDKVKPYTNLFVVDSWDLATNESLLNEVCDYAAAAGLNFIVYFDLISQTTYPWHQDWFQMAQTRWGDKFLGIYLHDELGGKQIDDKEYFMNASNYGDAANQFVTNIFSYYSNQFAKNHSIPIFTSDYALYWWDYLGGYDTVFAELGWNHSTTQQIAMCWGAANMQGKNWGAMITWTYYEPPYLGGPKKSSTTCSLLTQLEQNT